MSIPITKMKLWKVALLAFIAMLCQDVVGTAMVIFESRYLIVASGICDVLGFIASLICSALAIESIITNGWRSKRSLVIIASVTVANFTGTAIGVSLVAALTHHGVG